MIPQLDLLQKMIMCHFGMNVQNLYLGLNLGLKLCNGILLLQDGLLVEKLMHRIMR